MTTSFFHVTVVDDYVWWHFLILFIYMHVSEQRRKIATNEGQTHTEEAAAHIFRHYSLNLRDMFDSGPLDHRELPEMPL